MKESWEYYYNTLYNNDKLKNRTNFRESTLSKINERDSNFIFTNYWDILMSRTLKQAEFESVLEKFETIVKS